MLLLLFLLSLSSDSCHSQYVYGGLVPYDARYAVRRPPVRRSAIEALERLRLPSARYYPQVDTQVAPYPWTSGDLYALPPQWTGDFAQLPMDEDDYAPYEYESAPGAYAEEVYPQEADLQDGGALYSDLMSSYLMGAPETGETPEMFGNVQRRSDSQPLLLSKVLEANDNDSGTTPAPTTPPPSSALQTTVPSVQVTAVVSSPEKKNLKSLVVPDAVRVDSGLDRGQKEEPLFRPLQNSQRTIWSEMDDAALYRAKNTQNKKPIPLLKQMMQNKVQNAEDVAQDSLMEELTNLKKKKPGV